MIGIKYKYEMRPHAKTITLRPTKGTVATFIGAYVLYVSGVLWALGGMTVPDNWLTRKLNLPLA